MIQIEVCDCHSQSIKLGKTYPEACFICYSDKCSELLRIRHNEWISHYRNERNLLEEERDARVEDLELRNADLLVHNDRAAKHYKGLKAHVEELEEALKRHCWAVRQQGKFCLYCRGRKPNHQDFCILYNVKAIEAAKGDK